MVGSGCAVLLAGWRLWLGDELDDGVQKILSLALARLVLSKQGKPRAESSPKLNPGNVWHKI
jgi:hypothetical protein